jgi:outer membrane receptor protein involved in Fe transport
VDWNYTGAIEPRGTDFKTQALPTGIGEFHQLNARIGAQLTDATRLELWVDNLTNEFGVTRAIDLAGDGLPTLFTIRPRSVGATLRVNF